MAAQPGFVSYLVRHQEDKLSHDTAQVSLSLSLISTTGVRRPYVTICYLFTNGITSFDIVTQKNCKLRLAYLKKSDYKATYEVMGIYIFVTVPSKRLKTHNYLQSEAS